MELVGGDSEADVPGEMRRGGGRWSCRPLGVQVCRELATVHVETRRAALGRLLAGTRSFAVPRFCQGFTYRPKVQSQALLARSYLRLFSNHAGDILSQSPMSSPLSIVSEGTSSRSTMLL